ncbi:methylmalonyl-CoA mutase subunit beta [Flavobacterium psychrophilum]|uniref:methylmalonyl-CoA mutase subunit beta n=1 Tax=Flavobacterium psychrophilum TaxID=96345 RepID=UPI000B7C2DA6|nr:methylmalonyl-CoA mutase subunit beta [Flavobacterium psychrophilum]ELY2009908.1 methylmalonyl-CoA mutase subunit beta [Flavobacterium psychrophilum]ELY2016710.1 methylmalonyl-CoA mutase subunit beta [Flavobacterium psychrophilum]SNA81958.1 Methylmalonyl-CoA mutase small subunit [Flavobacterium psychrophilum]
METNLFNDFDSLSSKQWKQQIQFELKGADYNETLVWESAEGIKVKPFYHKDEDYKKTAITTEASKVKIVQNIFVFDIEKSIRKANDSIARGAESIRFTIENEDIDLTKLLSQIAIDKIPVYLNLKFLSANFIKKTNEIAVSKNTIIHCLIDPIHQLASDGNWFETETKDNFGILNTVSKDCKNISFININATLYQNAGANMVQQLAYTLAHTNEYFNHIQNHHHPITIEVSVGTNYFFEIAKIRALRLLFNTLAKEYNHDFDCHIIATPTKRNKTLYDYNTNMLRTTTECMSAILGGANAVANLAYDAIYHKDNEFGDRISRNQLLILKKESYFDIVNNPADGTYYIENLTAQLAEKALLLFKEIEGNGGFLKQLKEGNIQKKIQESAQKEQELFDSGKEILLGTNKYPNKNDKMSHDLELFPFVKIKPRKTLITPIIQKRLAEKMEQERLEQEKNN